MTQALWLLQAQGLVLVAAGATRAWKITAAGRLMLAPCRGPLEAGASSGGLRPSIEIAAVGGVASVENRLICYFPTRQTEDLWG